MGMHPLGFGIQSQGNVQRTLLALAFMKQVREPVLLSQLETQEKKRERERERRESKIERERERERERDRKSGSGFSIGSCHTASSLGDFDNYFCNTLHGVVQFVVRYVDLSCCYQGIALGTSFH